MKEVSRRVNLTRQNSQARIRSTVEEYNRKKLSDRSYVIMTACVASRDFRSHRLRTGHGSYITFMTLPLVAVPPQNHQRKNSGSGRT
jgi:hypothetical protein